MDRTKKKKTDDKIEQPPFVADPGISTGAGESVRRPKLDVHGSPIRDANGNEILEETK